MEFDMTDAITTFNVQLQTSLKALQNRIEALNAKGAASAEHAEKEIRAQISTLEENAHKAKASLDAAQAEVTKWVDDPSGMVSGWKAKFDAHKLNERAERAERHAQAASQVAIASVENAEKASLAAKLARADAASAKASAPV
jgi:BMFP domain-containing protein YqiC